MTPASSAIMFPFPYLYKNEESNAPARPSKSKMTTITGNIWCKSAPNVLLLLSGVAGTGTACAISADSKVSATTGFCSRYSSAVNGTALEESFGASSASGDHSGGSEASDQKSADSCSSPSCKNFFLRISVTSSEGVVCCGPVIDSAAGTTSSTEETVGDSSQAS